MLLEFCSYLSAARLTIGHMGFHLSCVGMSVKRMIILCVSHRIQLGSHTDTIGWADSLEASNIGDYRGGYRFGGSSPGAAAIWFVFMVGGPVGKA